MSKDSNDRPTCGVTIEPRVIITSSRQAHDERSEDAFAEKSTVDPLNKTHTHTHFSPYSIFSSTTSAPSPTPAGSPLSQSSVFSGLLLRLVTRPPSLAFKVDYFDNPLAPLHSVSGSLPVPPEPSQ